MNKEQQMLENYDRSLRLRSWADLFGYNVTMGQEGGQSLITVNGVPYQAKEAQEALVMAARAMGMEEFRLEGKQ